MRKLKYACPAGQAGVSLDCENRLQTAKSVFVSLSLLLFFFYLFIFYVLHQVTGVIMHEGLDRCGSAL